MRSIIQLLLLAILLSVPANFFAKPGVPQSPPNIAVTAALSPDKARRGRTVQGTVVMDIPSGFHVNSSRPLEKFLIATQLKIEPQKGLRVGTVIYPHPVLRNFKFSKNRVSVYEGHATMRFNVTVPANFSSGTTELKARLRYQSCNDEVCFPPQTRDVSLWLTIER
jgi:DsbC/DsbD-like thiol-disulfide interchange protein